MYIWFVFIESVYFFFIYVSMYYCISRCTICENTRFAKAWMFIMVCIWYCARSLSGFFLLFFHYDIAKRIVVFHPLNFALASFFARELFRFVYIYICMHIFTFVFLINSPFCSIFSFLWLYVVFNQAAYFKRIFRWYI